MLEIMFRSIYTQRERETQRQTERHTHTHTQQYDKGPIGYVLYCHENCHNANHMSGLTNMLSFDFCIEIFTQSTFSRAKYIFQFLSSFQCS